jgi:hypothetical protein
MVIKINCHTRRYALAASKRGGARPMSHGGAGKNAADPLDASLRVVIGGRTTLQIQGESLYAANPTKLEAHVILRV